MHNTLVGLITRNVLCQSYFHQSLLALQCRDKLPDVGMKTPDSRIGAAMPCFHCIRCPRYTECCVKVVVPHVCGEQCRMVRTAWKCPPDIRPLDALKQVVCCRRRKQYFHQIEQMGYLVGSRKRQSWYVGCGKRALLPGNTQLAFLWPVPCATDSS